MSGALNIQNIQALYQLKNALGRFTSKTQENLKAAESEIAHTQKWLEERVQHWRKEADRAKRAVEEARSALYACRASGYRDEQGYYHQPDCSGQAYALQRAETDLQDTQNNLQSALAWQNKVAQAVSEYQRELRRLSELMGDHTAKAQSALARTAEKYEAAQRAEGSIGANISTTVVPPPSQSASLPETSLGITWAEKQAILEKWQTGGTITLEEFERYKLPVNDLHAATLAEDDRLQAMINDGYLEAMRDSREAQNLQEAILAALKAINYWRSK